MKSYQYLVFWALAVVFVSGCISQSAAKASLDAPFQLKFAESATIDSENIKITFKNITQDSRCPSGVQCFWRGVATIEIDVSKGNERVGTFELSDYDIYNYTSRAIAGEYTITLKGLEPYPKTSEKISPADYVATLVVSRNPSQ